ncbi:MULTISPECIES: winged helix-turn-helix domain-containing protein [Aeromonas]|uniref:winged helix-turn-helix domain-containing protein n=1 Tax=Aeromonas TaxID=642 RepID=UPI0018F8077A
MFYRYKLKPSINEPAKLRSHDASRTCEPSRWQSSPSTQGIRAGWAKTYLVKAGLITQPKRGLCVIT